MVRINVNSEEVDGTLFDVEPILEMGVLGKISLTGIDKAVGTR